MKYIVVSYPKISKKNYDWIQKVRQKNDELYFNIIKPHFTLVFPLSSVFKKDLIKHSKTILSKTKKFEFLIKKAVIEKDAFNKYTHTFLVPDNGYNKIIKLHNKLYTGILKPELKKDIPYIPHIGIGNNKNPEISRKLAEEINTQKIIINGLIDKIDICEYENDKITTIGIVRLKD